MTLKGRKHNSEDIKSTVLAVDPIKFVHKGRLEFYTFEFHNISSL